MTSKALALKASPLILASGAFIVNLFCGLGLALAFWAANSLYSINLITDPSRTLFLIWYMRSVGRGILGVPVGALLNCLGAIALGAPVTFQCLFNFNFEDPPLTGAYNEICKFTRHRYLPKTVNWSLVMSLLTTVPASCVLGSSWADWQRIFAQTKPNGPIEYLICLQAHGAVIGGWFGAWPMPLDWERPWQEWPICSSYGALAGYLVALVASLAFVLAHHKLQHVKKE